MARVESLEFYRARVRVDKHALDEELSQHAEKLEEIGRHCAYLIARALEAKTAMKEAEALCRQRLRADAPRMSVEDVNAACQLDPACKAAARAYHQAEERVGEWEALNRAWYQRGFDAKALGELYASDYFATTQTSITAGNHGDRGPDFEARRAMRQASADIDRQKSASQTERPVVRRRDR